VRQHQHWTECAVRNNDEEKNCLWLLLESPTNCLRTPCTICCRGRAAAAVELSAIGLTAAMHENVGCATEISSSACTIPKQEMKMRTKTHTIDAAANNGNPLLQEPSLTEHTPQRLHQTHNTLCKYSVSTEPCAQHRPQLQGKHNVSSTRQMLDCADKVMNNTAA
jgi:hypothetical protein